MFAFEILDNHRDSFFYFGDYIDDTVISETVFLPVTRADRWTIDIIGFYINGEDYTKKITNQALIDSGTSLMVVNSG